ncbi:hypothetical protein [Kribbella sindirgiensis]|uniref:Uncharacterized protein n=1 Tax=Kribbella sindirgiensis TaxID=1124744 RepID=A0A4R0J1X2_9ACTN|nr:hypothetical protein [Kribbella sindirgiensis]TCC39370.1 hypothetical protein E0H50_05395 [Kribbella sindirgiensis]
MTEGPNEPAYEDRIDLSEVRKSVDSLNVEPAQPYDGPISSLMSPYEPPADPPSQSAAAQASSEE